MYMTLSSHLVASTDKLFFPVRRKTFIVSGNDHFMACGDRNVDITNSISRTDLRTFCVESDSKRTTFLNFLCLASIVNHTLMVLYRQYRLLSEGIGGPTSYDP